MIRIAILSVATLVVVALALTYIVGLLLR